MNIIDEASVLYKQAVGLYESVKYNYKLYNSTNCGCYFFKRYNKIVLVRRKFYESRKNWEVYC